ncbi:NUDIX hydrolase, putative [Bodo saltans]|uniref:NUDIX hydrolase, putative n=1 Tax=Bodo saltans TaxID=75058 RepID=A0A0S4IQ68_BODSA|nr:NUDIX hydrolase, putative [Bodo saltans]|eukprot:CUF93504.1 NUDIX hydrolase, putative [Bodo saltans]
MISAGDALFLRRLTHTLTSKKLDVYRPGKRRTSAAVILRFGNDNSDQVGGVDGRVEVSKLFSKWDRGMSADDVVRRLEQNVDIANLDRPSDIRLLFVKRALFTSDRWSGQVALPGGARDPEDADDKATLRRETYHELGIPLDSPDFILLGRLEDYQPRSRVLTDFDEVNGAVQARFVYLHIGDLTPSVTLSRIEIEAVRWCPLRILTNPKSIDPARVNHHMLHFIPMLSTDVGSMFRDFFPNTFVRFPSIAVEPSLPNWRIWGLPMRTVSEVVELYPTLTQVRTVVDACLSRDKVESNQSRPRELILHVDGLTSKRPPIDWPRYSSNNFLVQFLMVDAYHGYLRLRSTYFQGSQRFEEPYVLFALFTTTLLLYSMVLTFVTMIYTISVALLIATNFMESEEWAQRKRDYYAEHVYASPLTPAIERTSAKARGDARLTSNEEQFASATLEKRILQDSSSFLHDLKKQNATDEPIRVVPTLSVAPLPIATPAVVAAPQCDSVAGQPLVPDNSVFADSRGIDEPTSPESLEDVLTKYRNGKENM